MVASDPTRRRGDLVQWSELELRQTGGHRGGAAQLYRCHYGGRRWLYKEYRESFLARIDEAALTRLVAWRRELGQQERTRLDQMASWPRSRVYDDAGSLRGVLIPEARLKFSYLPQYRHRLPRTIDVLIRLNAAGNVRAGAPTAVKQRALGRTAQAILWLHERGVTVNDVQAHNVLCADDGGAVYLVDCDAMIGPWGQVSPPQAPPYVREVVPDADHPNRTTDLARLAWMAMWTLLDEFSDVGIPVARLAKRVGQPEAELLARTGRARRWDPAPTAEWRELADRWAGEPAAGPPPVISGIVLPPARQVTVGRTPAGSTQVSRKWVPARFRRRQHQQGAAAEPGMPAGSYPSVGSPEPSRPQRTSRLLVLLVAATIVGAIVLADLLWAVTR